MLFLFGINLERDIFQERACDYNLF